jgi:tetratricopeptide (TPR) repeat protein
LRISLYILFSFLLAGNAIAQTREQTVELALQQKALKNYTGAESFFLRALFFEPGPERAFLYGQLGECCAAKNEFDKAAANYELAYNNEKNDSLKTEWLFAKTAVLLLQEKYQYAFAELFSLPDSISNSYFTYKRNFYLGVAYFGNSEFALSERYFLNSIPATYAVQRTAIEEIFKRNQKISRIKPKTARILSMCLPGLGQFYAGDIKNGLNSLVINGLFVCLFTYAFITISPLDAYLSVLPWFQRYYSGGYKKAGIIAAEKAKRKRSVLYFEIMEVIASTKQ